MAISSVTTYAAIAVYPTNIEVIGATFCLFGFGSSLAWAGLGSILQKFLHRPKLLHAFNIVMALLLVASLYPLFTEAMQP
jgi:threonine/homoserine/homoserine lactone efflux protein